MLKKKKLAVIHYALLIALFVLVCVIRNIPALGDGYSRHIYPHISKILSTLSGFVPFPVGDVFIILAIAGLIAFPFWGRYKGKKWKKIFPRMATFPVWVYIWFYLAWGLNYSQYNFYQRTGVPYSAYSPENFRAFVREYTDSLNASYTPVAVTDKEQVRQEVYRSYRSPGVDGIRRLDTSPRVKTMLLSPLMSKAGVSGYLNPFFCEFCVNRDIPPSQYPATYAHELAHFLGVSGEAEANFHAYLACIRSDVPEIRFSGYFSILNHVLSNAAGFMDKESYTALLAGIRPEILELAVANREHWKQLYSPAVGEIQKRFYDFYLKGNKIQSGRKNYSEVIGLLISWYKYKSNN